MNKKTAIALTGLLLTMGCEESDPALTAALLNADASAPAAQLAWKSSQQTWPSLCTVVKVELQNAHSKAVEALEDTPIRIAASHVSFYSDAACTIPLTTLDSRIPKKSSFKQLYVKGLMAASGEVKVDSTKLNGASLNLTVGDPNSDLVLGQPDFMTNTANLGGLSGHSLSSPMTPSSDGQNLFVADGSNNRILIWKTLNPTLGAQAEIVLGQPNFYANIQDGTQVSAQTLGYVSSVFSDGTRLFAADRKFNRILIWNSIPATNFQPADVVLGQPNMNSSTSNNGGTSSKSLFMPESIFSDGQKLIVTDTGNNRILIWNSIPTSNFQAADVVVGQPNMYTSSAGSNGAKLNSPYFSIISKGKLLVSDFLNNRILVWNLIPTVNGSMASLAIGQTSLTTRIASTLAAGLTHPGGLRVDSLDRLYVVDHGSNRILIWNQIPSVSGTAADINLGQINFQVLSSALNLKKFLLPWGLEIGGQQMWIADNGNNRVLRIPIP